ncbi:MAG TPA: hypothetical protein VH302_07465 [Bryobacteraceae bacterium]|nr:hypothetical protein [Bryobacteraceae bacterium]
MAANEYSLIDDEKLPDEPPPFLRNWRSVYTAILVYLALLIVTLYVLTRIFAA